MKAIGRGWHMQGNQEKNATTRGHTKRKNCGTFVLVAAAPDDIASKA
jgi:hypothetical protein